MKSTIAAFYCSLLAFVANGQTGIISTVAGNGSLGYNGDGGLATLAKLNNPSGIRFDDSGNLYIADANNYVIRKVNKLGIISTVAGNGVKGYLGDGALAINAKLNTPADVAVDHSGNLYICDNGNNVIRKVNTSGIITTVAGSGSYGYSGDSGLATLAQFNNPTGIATDKLNNIYIVDQSNNVIRKINASGIITTFAGKVGGGFSGDYGPATLATLFAPIGVRADDTGNIFITDHLNYRVRKVNSFDTITTVAGNGTVGYGGDGGTAISSELNAWDVAVDSKGNIYIAGGNKVRKVNTSGIISTIAGTGVAGYNGDGIRPDSAELFGVYGIAIDASDNLYIADAGNSRIRKVTFNVGITNIENAQNNISIYPNPAANQICISASIKIESIIITNAVGQVVYIPPAPKGVYTFGGTIQIDVRNFAAGVYFVKINGAFVQKFVKE